MSGQSKVDWGWSSHYAATRRGIRLARPQCRDRHRYQNPPRQHSEQFRGRGNNRPLPQKYPERFPPHFRAVARSFFEVAVRVLAHVRSQSLNRETDPDCNPSLPPQNLMIRCLWQPLSSNNCHHQTVAFPSSCRACSSYDSNGSKRCRGVRHN